jgi:hypothetical protein
MRIYFLAVLYLLVASWSYGQTPTPGVSANKPNKQNADPQEKPDADQRGTDKAPLVIKMLPYQSSEPLPAPHANQVTQKTTDWDWWWDKSPEILIALFTLLLWLATRSLVRGADETARKELRAYMGVATNRILKGQGATEPNCVELVIQNFGKTMAKDTKIWINATITAEAITNFPLGDIKSKTVVMPNESLGFQHDIELAKNTPGRIYLWGRIEYEDVFKKPHWTAFRFMDDKTAWLTSMTGETPGWTTKTCDEGNDADDN